MSDASEEFVMWSVKSAVRWIAGIAVAGVIVAGTVQYSPPARADIILGNGVHWISPDRIRQMSVDELLDWSKIQFEAVVQANGSYGGVGEEDDKAFVGLPGTREVLNATKAVGVGDFGGVLFDGVAFVGWTKSLRTAFGEDTSNLETAATLTAMIPVLGEVLGLAVAIKDGDKTEIAANAVALVASVLAFASSDPAVALTIGLVGLLIVSFIHAFSMPDPSPIAMEHLKQHRDEAFARMIDDLAADYVQVMSESFAVSQGQQVIAAGLAAASLDRNAEIAAKADPARATSIREEATVAKAALQSDLQASLDVQRANLQAGVKNAFRELVKTEVAKPETVKTVTDTVFPLYEGNGGYAWDAGTGKVTPGWVYFAAEAGEQYYCLHERGLDYKERTAADFAAGADLQDCDRVIYAMNATYVPNVKALRSIPLPTPSDQVLDAAVDTALANEQTRKNLTVFTIPAL
ncbi:MAG: hypothetical protein AAGC66_15325 [Leifsonia sp.]